MSLLRQVVREFLKEAAVNMSAASSEGLALYIINANDIVRLLLYSPKDVESYVGPAIQQNSLDEVKLMDALEKSIRGLLILVQPYDACNGAYEVKNSVAEKGFGPLVYDIGMSTVPSIMSDRGSVSSSATNVWRHYFDNRGDVNKKKLDDKKRPQTPDPEDDCEVHGDQGRPFLDFSYSATSRVDPKALVQNHLDFLEELSQVLKKHGWRKENIVKMLEIFSEELFAKRFRE